MAIQEQRTANRTSITVVVVVLLCAAGYAYSQGWLDWSRLGSETTDGNNANVSQELDEQETNGSSAPKASELPATSAK